MLLEGVEWGFALILVFQALVQQSSVSTPELNRLVDHLDAVDPVEIGDAYQDSISMKAVE